MLKEIDFMALRKPALAFSIVLILLALSSLAYQGLKLGLDFTGGTLVELEYDQAADLKNIRETLANSGYPEAIVQSYGADNDVLVRIAPREELSSAELSNEVFQTLSQAYSGEVTQRRVEFVGPQVGDELTEDGGLAMLFALIGILIYVAARFEKRFSFGAVAALLHDVLIIVGIFSLLQMEFDLTVLAALLAVIGYSLNDTIVVYDRIRENFLRLRKAEPIEVINISINQTLSRTLKTSLTTLLVLLSLYFLGGASINAFAFALIAGIVVGTYSSIFVASSAALMMGVTKYDLMPPEKEGEEESLP